MPIQYWSEGQSHACLPQAVVCFAMAFGVQAAEGAWWSLWPFGLGIGFLVCESGFVWNHETRACRSYTGWVVRGRIVGWGRWKCLPEKAMLRLEHTRASMMNRRGAARAIKIESWELQWQAADGNWHALHDFVDRHLANQVMDRMRLDLERP